MFTSIRGGGSCVRLGQPRGSECDSAEESAFHLVLFDSAVACGRFHLNNFGEAQVRYVAVDEDVRGRGYAGRISSGTRIGGASAKNPENRLKCP